MDLAAWQKGEIDPVRARRLAVGYVTGAVLVASVLVTVARTAAKAYGLGDEPVVEAALVETAKEEPEVVVKEEHHEQPVQKPKAPAPLTEPTKMDDKLVEKEPAHTDNPYATNDPYALIAEAEEQRTNEERPKVQEAPQAIEKPKASAQKSRSQPIRVTEDVTPPRSISMSAPGYPPEAKAAGVEGTVFVEYVVNENGAVTNVKAVRGPPELMAVCVAAVQSWRFTPAIKDGQAVAVHRLARFPFRIRT